MNIDSSKSTNLNTGEVGTELSGWVTSVNADGAPGYYQVRLPTIHGYCDINEQNCEEVVVKKAALPWIATIQSDRANAFIRNNDVKQLTQGQAVVVKFDGPNYTSPVIISTCKLQHPALSLIEGFTTSGTNINAQCAVPLKNGNYSASYAGGHSPAGVAPATEIQDNGTSTKAASKCGTGGGLSNNIGAVIGDFMKIIQDSDGKIGSKFVNGITGELSNSLTKYANLKNVKRHKFEIKKKTKQYTKFRHFLILKNILN